jgi:hypothetical protein
VLARRAADAALAAGARAFAPRGKAIGGAPSYWATGGGEAGAALLADQEEEEDGADIFAGAPSFVGGDTVEEGSGGVGGEEGWTL